MPVPPPVSDPGRIVSDALSEIHTAELAAEVLQTVLRECDNEEKRRAALDTKATSLLAAAGVSVGVSITFAVQLVKQLPGGTWQALGLFLFALAFAAAVFAAYKALTTLRVENQSWLSEKDLFRREALTFRNDGEEQTVGVAMYRKYLAEAWWLVCTRQNVSRQERARRLRWGQRSFVVFLGAASLLGLLDVTHSLWS